MVDYHDVTGCPRPGAADEIDSLRADNERLRLALDAIVHYSRQPNSMGAIASDYAAELRGMRDIARLAISWGKR